MKHWWISKRIYLGILHCQKLESLVMNGAVVESCIRVIWEFFDATRPVIPVENA